MAKAKSQKKDTSDNFGFEAKLRAAADAIRNKHAKATTTVLEQPEVQSELWTAA